MMLFVNYVLTAERIESITDEDALTTLSLPIGKQ